MRTATVKDGPIVCHARPSQRGLHAREGPSGWAYNKSELGRLTDEKPMSNTANPKASELAPHVRRAVENMLGRPLDSEEHIT